VSAFEQALQRNADNPIYHYHLGLAHLKLKHEERARASLRRALQLKPDFPGADDARRVLEETKTAAR
jgi:Flp pilus assembly protein TadD